MPSPVLLCTDGSDLALEALRDGLALLAPGTPVVVVTVMDAPDYDMVTGTGFAGGVMSEEEFDERSRAAVDESRSVVDSTRQALGLGDAAGQVLQGEPGPAICRYAEESGASAVVLGSRGRGGLKRAVLGSVSDHVVRHAPCPVVVTGSKAVEELHEHQG